MTSVGLHVNLTIRKGGHTLRRPLTYSVEVLETPNAPQQNPGGRCPGPSDEQGRCHDRISVMGEPPMVYLPNGIKYAASLEFHGPTATNDNTAFWTGEMDVTGANMTLAFKPLC